MSKLAIDARPSLDPLAGEPLVTNGHGVDAAHSRSRRATLTIAALGVVYGDIGTSPLYAVRESVLAASGGGRVPIQFAILGAISLIFWSLILVVTVKYVGLIMKADNDGEGGVLALAS